MKGFPSSERGVGRFARLTSQTYCLVMDDDQWPGEWLRGVLSLCVLAVVAEGGRRTATPSPSACRRPVSAPSRAARSTPVLTRLETDGLLTSAWREGDGGPGRKVVSITDPGRTELAARADSWLTFTQRAVGLLPPTPPARRRPPRPERDPMTDRPPCLP